MNKQIALLALKASDPNTGWLDRQKFAQLIIRECIGEVYPDTFKVDGVEPANLADAVSRIKHHFGVEL